MSNLAFIKEFIWNETNIPTYLSIIHNWRIMFSNLFRNSAICIFIALFVVKAADLKERIPRVPPDAKTPADTIFDQSLLQIVNATFHDQFDLAIHIADSLIEKRSDHPAPYFFKAAILQGVMSTYRINWYQKEVERNVAKSIEVGNVLMTKSTDPWLHFYVGGAYGYRGFNRFRKLNFIGAYRDAQRGIGHFEKALQKDSTLYDIYLGLGSYYYWRTAKSKFLRIITFWIPDKRELGMAQLQFTIDHGRYAVYDALYVLLAALYDFGNYDKGFQLTLQAIQMKEAPNLTDLYFKGKFLAKKQKWSEVKSTFEEILEKIKDHPYQSIGYQVECKYWIARALSEEGKPEEALQLVREALAQSRQRNSDTELEGHLESFDMIRSDLENLNNKLTSQLTKKN